MFIDSQVVKKFDGEERFDKFAIAAVMFAVSFEGASCSLIESQALRSCDCCNLKHICDKVDGIVDEYTEKTTEIAEKFKFNN